MAHSRKNLQNLKKFPASYQPIFTKLIPLEVHHKTTFLAESWYSGPILVSEIKIPKVLKNVKKVVSKQIVVAEKLIDRGVSSVTLDRV